ncbi:MAG: hypothetical protein ACOCQ1_04470 [Halanaerobiaceae bacterium]
MSDLEKIVVLNDEIEASLLKDILKERDIPFLVKSYDSLAYDGIFQNNWGWGHIEADPKYRAEIEEIYQDIKNENN